MGHKVNPTGIRLGVIKEHNSVWYAEKQDYADKLLNDLQVRKFIDKRRNRRAKFVRYLLNSPRGILHDIVEPRCTNHFLIIGYG